MRPESQASNISRPRDPPPDPFRRSSGRTRQNHHRKIEEVAEYTRQEHHQKLSKLTKQWNEFFMCNKTFMDSQASEVAELEEVIDEKDAMIQDHQLRVEAYATDCDTLKMENDDLRASHKQLENDLMKSTQRVGVMEEKLSTYRQRLSDAIKEHQQLYTRYRDRCKETIAQLKEEKQNWRELVDKELAVSDSSRVALKEKVNSVVRDARENAQELETTITTLKVKLEDREREVMREQDHANDLRAQLEKSQGLQEQTLHSIVVIGKELLHEILKAIEEVKTKATESQTSTNNMQELMTRDLPQVMEDLQHAVSGCGIPAEAVTQLKDGINSIYGQCDAIREQTFNSQAASDWQNRYHSANLELADQNQQVEYLSNQLVETTEGWNTALEKLDRQKEQLEGLQAEVAQNQDSNSRVEELVEQVERLEEILTAKDQAIEQSDEVNRAAKEELGTQARIIQETENQIRKDKEEYEEALNKAYQEQERAIQAVSEEKAELLQREEKLQKHLDGMPPNLEKVQQDYVEARKLSSRLAEDLRAAQAEREAFKVGHEEWARTHSEVIQIRQIAQRLAKDIPKAEKNKHISELCKIEKILSKKLIGHEEPSVLLPHMRQRQVQLQLREDHAGTPDLPISVEQERATRRRSEVVRGIMKPMTRSAAKEMSESAVADHIEERPATTQPAPRPRVARRGSQAPPNTYSSYNRIVAGNVSSGGLKQEYDTEEQGVGGHGAQPKPTNNKRAQTDTVDGIDENPKKRQRKSTSEGQTSKASLSKSTSISRGGSGEVSKSQSGSAPTRSRAYQRSPSGLITYGSQQSRSSHDDSQTSAASSATMRSTSSRSTPISSQIKESIQNGFPQLQVYEDYE
ncbi:hypothetical protein SLS62_004415 [Diatrype stigma]|uniref:Uncharacterized protein n=1 Tax=Diatrype stigma TaxID=117547 RepID=A0AAN9YT33_9PEZI